MRSTRISLAFLVGLLLTACSDLPTSPLLPEDIESGTYYHGAGCVTDGVCVLPPITVTPGDDCDPWLSLSWCAGGGGPCAADVGGEQHSVGADGCVPVGGPGGGGPGTPPPGIGGPICPDWDPHCVPQEEPQPDPCDTGDPIVDAPGVYNGFAELWTLSLQNGVEQGGWIVQEGNSYRLVPFQDADFSACGIDVYEPKPAGAVSVLHTHPWPLGSMTPCGYFNTGTPSDEDRAALAQAGFSVGYFLDGLGIGKFTPQSVDLADRIGRCGF